MDTPNPTDLRIRPLQPAQGEAWLHFFDREAFADNPRWASCYCQYPTHPHAEQPWQARSADDNRALACGKLAAGTQTGWIAEADGRVVGWVHAGPWRQATIMDEAPEPLAERLAAITCFIVAPAWRGRGVATALLEGACAGLAAQGFVAVDAWSRADAEGAAALHIGPLPMYRRAGFETLREVDGALLLRRRLSPAD